MGIYRFNQNGVADSLTFGRQGGIIKHNKTDFQLFQSDGSTPSALIIANEFSGSGHAATREDIDRKLQGLRTKKAVDVHIPGNIDITQAITATHDGMTLLASMRILCSGQTLATENGIYQISETLVPVRADDAAEYNEIEGAFVYVAQGTQYEGTGWVMNVLDDSDKTATAGSFDIEVKQFHGKGTTKVQTGLEIVDGTEIKPAFQQFSARDHSTAEISYNDSVVLVGADNTHYKSTVESLVTNLGIAAWRIQSKGNEITVNNGLNGTRNSIMMGVAANNTHNANTAVVQISASEFTVDHTNTTPKASAVGSSIALKAGHGGTTASGGSVSFAGGNGKGVGGKGGDIVFTPGTAEDTGTDNGLVRFNTSTAVKLPYGTKAQRPIGPEAGLIRVCSDAVNGRDILEIYDVNTVKWTAVGSGVKLSDLDGDTYISVAAEGSVDSDVIRFQVGSTGSTHQPTEAMVISDQGIKVKVPDALDKDATIGHGIELLAGDGSVGGDITLTAGKQGAAGTTSVGAGKVTINAWNGFTAITGDGGTNASAGISLKTGDSSTNVGKIEIQTGVGQGSEILIGTTSARNVAIGNNKALDNSTTAIHGKASIRIGAISAGVVGSADIEIGDRVNTVQSKLFGKSVIIGGGTTTDGLVNVVAETINIGNDASTTSINIGNTGGVDDATSTDVTVTSEDLLLTANKSLTVRAATENLNVQFETSGTGVLSVASNTYTESVIADNHIPNRKFVTDAFTNATHGGVGIRTFAYDFAVGNTIHNIGTPLPTNARITKVVVEIVTPFNAGTLSADIKADNKQVISNNDIDLALAGLYIIDKSGRDVHGGQLVLEFNVSPDTGTAGELYITVEFHV